MTTPDEIEVARRNLVAELKAAAGSKRAATHGVVLDVATARDLIAVLEASKPTVVDREAVGKVLRAELVQRGVDEFHDPAPLSRQLADAVLAALYPKAAEGTS